MLAMFVLLIPSAYIQADKKQQAFVTVMCEMRNP
jgi:hypothetical protein